MKTLLDSIARRRDPDAEEWTDNQVYAIQTRFEALVHKYHLLPGDPKAHRRRTAGASLPGLRGKKHVMSNAELRDATEEIFVQVVAEYESAHWTLSEEGSALWLEAFDKLRRINLVPLLTLVVTMITPLVFYYRIFLPCVTSDLHTRTFENTRARAHVPLPTAVPPPLCPHASLCASARRARSCVCMQVLGVLRLPGRRHARGGACPRPDAPRRGRRPRP